MRPSKPVLTGIGSSPGIAVGTVRILRNSLDEMQLGDGDILVARMTDPTMVSAMNRAGAIVCDIGGLTSHASILARELGIPCVVSTGEGTKKLRDGERIKVDGKTGEISLA